MIPNTQNSKVATDPNTSDSINESMAEHKISFVLPFGARMEGVLTLEGGALIYGDFIGDIYSKFGSLIIKKGGRFQGAAEADSIYIEGHVSSQLDNPDKSRLIARKKIIGFSSARIDANVFSDTFETTKAKVWGAIKTLAEGNAQRQRNKAIPRSTSNSLMNPVVASAVAAAGEISISIREHNIGFILTAQDIFEGKLLLPCGALIHGQLFGDIFCESGSLVVSKFGYFRGIAEADLIYVEGVVATLKGIKRKSVLIARKMIAGSSNAKINADIFSQTFTIHKSTVKGTMRTFEESGRVRSSNQATQTNETQPKAAEKPTLASLQAKLARIK